MSESNPFVIDETTQEGGAKYITVNKVEDFIQPNLKVTKLEIPEGANYIDIEAANSGGLVVGKRLYFPKAKEDYSDEKKYLNAVKIFMGNMACIGRRFMGESYKATGTTAMEVAKKVIVDVTPKLGTKTVYGLLELREGSDGKLYSNLDSYKPFSDDGKDLTVSAKQIQLLREKLSTSSVKPDADAAPTGGLPLTDQF
jgi:hypothetical protein